MAVVVRNPAQPGIDVLLRVIDAGNILFAAEMIGAVRGVDPATGLRWDVTKRYLDASGLSTVDKQRVYEGRPRRVYPRLVPLLAGRAAGPGAAGS